MIATTAHLVVKTQPEIKLDDKLDKPDENISIAKVKIKTTKSKVLVQGKKTKKTNN